MLNPIVSSIVYAFDMLIIYIFFCRTSDKNTASAKCIFVGLVLFEFGSVCNLVFQNNLLVNTIVSIAIRFSFGVLSAWVIGNTCQ